MWPLYHGKLRRVLLTQNQQRQQNGFRFAAEYIGDIMHSRWKQVKIRLSQVQDNHRLRLTGLLRGAGSITYAIIKRISNIVGNLRGTLPCECSLYALTKRGFRASVKHARFLENVLMSTSRSTHRDHHLLRCLHLQQDVSFQPRDSNTPSLHSSQTYV